jgi:hypothetical protein
LTEIFSKDEEETIKYLENTDPDQLYWISEVFDDISGNLQSQKFIGCIENLARKYKKLDMYYDIEFAKKAIKNKKNKLI